MMFMYIKLFKFVYVQYYILYCFVINDIFLDICIMCMISDIENIMYIGYIYNCLKYINYIIIKKDNV